MYIVLLCKVALFCSSNYMSHTNFSLPLASLQASAAERRGEAAAPLSAEPDCGQRGGLGTGRGSAPVDAHPRTALPRGGHVAGTHVIPGQASLALYNTVCLSC